MSEANTATYVAHERRAPIPGSAPRTARPAPRTRAPRAIPSRVRAARTLADRAPPRQVREDKAFYVPGLHSVEHFKENPEVHRAASRHAKHLRKAERDLDDALNLVRVLIASLEDEGDSRAMQADTVLRIVERKIDKAHDRIDRHASRHKNLYLAYFDLKAKAEEAGVVDELHRHAQAGEGERSGSEE